LLKISNITIIGLGVIGGSMGLALKKRHPDLWIRGVDVSEEIIQEALARKAIDEGGTDAAAMVKGAELVVLAAPMTAVERLCQEIAPHLSPGTIVTDTGSTKARMVQVITGSLPAGVSFVGGHPMAGSEKSGLQGASEILFENAAYILTPLPESGKEAVRTVQELVESIGARTILLSPEEHDRKVAAVSHLPHVVASALVNVVGALESSEGGYFCLAAGGFRDTTRIAASNSEMWTDILLQNKQALLPLLRGYRQCLQEFERALENQKPGVLYQLLNGARERRRKVPTGLKSILPQLFELTVVVPDVPGVIGKVAALLGSRQINISDIEIMRVREEDDGTLRLGFGQEEHRDLALRVLVENGYTVKKSGI